MPPAEIRPALPGDTRPRLRPSEAQLDALADLLLELAGEELSAGARQDPGPPSGRPAEPAA
jgi:hypothetical protein